MVDGSASGLNARARVCHRTAVRLVRKYATRRVRKIDFVQKRLYVRKSTLRTYGVHACTHHYYCCPQIQVLPVRMVDLLRYLTHPCRRDAARERF
jgi:hypothetical protein